MADIIVAPMLLPDTHPVSVANGVFNAIMVNGNALGDAMFYGQGAGKLPTASAVVADIIECIMHMDNQPHDISWDISGRENVIAHVDCPVKVLVRLRSEDNIDIAEQLFAPYGYEKTARVFDDEIALVVGLNSKNQLTEQSWQVIMQKLGKLAISYIRIWQP
jgi:homoserine dehydrogenase